MKYSAIIMSILASLTWAAPVEVEVGDGLLGLGIGLQNTNVNAANGLLQNSAEP